MAFTSSSYSPPATKITVVANYSALPDPTTVSGKFYWAEASQGTSWLPGSLGGTYYNSGMYYSNGTNWSFVNVPYQATLAEVNTGTNDDKFVTPKTLTDSDINLSLIEWRKLGWSAGAISGFAVTNNGDGTANIASGVALLRTTVSSSGVLNKYSISGVTNQSFTDNTVNYVYANYNSGTPIISVTTNSTDINTLTTTLLYLVVRQGTNIYYQNTIEQNVDSNGKLRRRFLISERFAYGNGAIISNPATRKIAFTAGTFFTGLTPISTPAFNTNVSDTFTYVYYNGTNYTRTTGQTDINNTNYINAGVSTTMTNNRFRTDYVYFLVDNPTQLWVVQGDAQYLSLSEAISAPIPTNLPPELNGLGIVAGRVVIEKSATTLNVASPFTAIFSGGTAPTHNQLAGLQGGTTNEYYHLTAQQHSYYDPTSSIQTQLNARIKNIVVDTANSSAVTGVITESLCKTYQIIGGTFSASDFFKFMVSAEKTGGNAVFRISVKLNTTNNSATATQVATFITTNAGFTDVAIERVRLAFKGGNLRGLGFSTSVMTDITNSSNAKGSMALDPANDIWMYVFVTPSSASDSIVISDVQVTN